MTLDEIRDQLGRARGIPRAALAAAVDEAEALEPEVLNLIDLACKGIVLTLPQELVMFYGIHALAAAKRTALHVPLLALIECRPYDLEALLADSELQALLISTCGPDEEPPYDLLENSEVPGEAKTALFLLITWMVRQGRASREEFVGFLDRFDREPLAETDDFCWFGWQSAIVLMGLPQFEERVRAGWQAGRLPYFSREDREEWIADIRRPAAEPGDAQLFLQHHAWPIADVFASLRWMEVLGLDRPMEEDEAEPDDPASDLRLIRNERDWFVSFLQDEFAPDGAMSLECVDGFLTALAAGPRKVPREEWWPRVWSEFEGEEPRFETEELEAYLRDLIDRHYRAVTRRLETGYRIRLLIDEESDADAVTEWAIGFAIGTGMRPGSWDSINRHKQGALAVASIYVLLPPEFLASEEEELELLDDPSRAKIVANLPDLVRTVYAFWHDQPMLPLFAPRRSEKVGRNEPCPCGSGRKYKKCCGANAPN